MEWIGDLERAFAAVLYPNRVAIAIGLAIALVALVWFAARRGWFAAARRHPRRTAVVVIVLLAVGGPVGWYLGSPLFIRTELVEAAPSTAPATPPPAAAPATGVAPTTAPDDPTPAPTAPILAAERTGTFRGADDFHFGRGTARLVETAPGTWIVRFEDFSVRNGPDLYVYLSPDPDGYDEAAIELGTLKATDGSYNMDVPAGTDVTGLHSVVIWCKQFAVLFAVAPLR